MIMELVIIIDRLGDGYSWLKKKTKKQHETLLENRKNLKAVEIKYL